MRMRKGASKAGGMDEGKEKQKHKILRSRQRMYFLISGL